MAKTAVNSKAVADDLARLYRKDGYKVSVTKVPKGTYYYKIGKRYHIEVKGL